RARARAAAARGGKAWLYRYGYVPDAAGGKAAGAGHDAEMEMVFMNRDLRWPGPWSDADAAMARAVNGYWINFARTGNPNGPGLPAWPAYSGEGDTLMGFGQAGAAAVQHFGKARLDAIDATKGGTLGP
ncbi:MAG TPA: carboxylesterase family protein, partial [Caulobacteraceae bacterium]